LEQHDFDVLSVGRRFSLELFADLAREPVALFSAVGTAPLILNCDGERGPVEEAVPDSEIEFVLQLGWSVISG
jgi:hypothetical protein